MNKVLILADDLTGANDTGAVISKLGLNTCSVVDDEAMLYGLETYDCISVNLNSRSLNEEDAYEKVCKAVKKFGSTEVCLYSKRIDTTLRGNLGQECDALLDELENNGTIIGRRKLSLQGRAAMIVPAFPQAGRIYRNDTLYVNGVPLADTSAAKDPKRPVNTSSALELFRKQSRRKAEVIGLETVQEGKEKILEAVGELVNHGIRLILFEAVTQGDIEKIADAIQDAPIAFIAVDPGTFTACLTARMVEKEKEIKPIQTNQGSFDGESVLAVIGSVNAVAKEQTNRLLKRMDAGYAVLEIKKLLENEEERQREISLAVRTLRKLKKEKKISVLLFSSSVEENHTSLEPFAKKEGVSIEALCERLNSSIAQAAAELMEEGDYGGIFTTGGDITAAVCMALQADCIRIRDEILPLAVGGEIVLPTGPVVCLATKGGMVGGENASCYCIEYLLEQLKENKTK